MIFLAGVNADFGALAQLLANEWPDTNRHANRDSICIGGVRKEPVWIWLGLLDFRATSAHHLILGLLLITSGSDGNFLIGLYMKG